MKFIPPEEYYKSLPKKRMSAGTLFFNSKGELPIVKPNYKENWLIVGGVVDENESPRAAAIREIKEEIGLEIKDLSLVCIEYVAEKGIKTEALHFTFSGGILSNERISQIKLQTDELDTFTFVSPEEAVTLLTPNMIQKISECLKVAEGVVLYRES